MAIKIFITGGSVDGLDYDSIEKAPNNPKTHIPNALKQSRVTVDCNVEILMMKGSRFVMDSDREIILKKCQECKEDNIVITHGTLTMPLTAKFLGRHNMPKTTVLFGSAFPINEEKTDALLSSES